MRDFSRKAIELSEGKTEADLVSDETLRYALTHLLELVGEAAAKVPAEVQQSYPQIPWPKIIGMRNRLIHGYDFVDNAILWNALRLNLPLLLRELDLILPTD
jgi:uncharacterized protein with HEPN domain